MEAEAAVNSKYNKVPRKGRSRPRDYARMYLRKDIVRKFVDANKEHEAKASAAGLSWDTRTACIVERSMVITPEPEQWEEEFLDLQVPSTFFLSYIRKFKAYVADQENLKYYKQYDFPKGIGMPSPEEIERMPGINATRQASL